MDELCGTHERYVKLLHMSENLKRIYAVAGTPYTVDIILNWIRFSCLGFAPVTGLTNRWGPYSGGSLSCLTFNLISNDIQQY